MTLFCPDTEFCQNLLGRLGRRVASLPRSNSLTERGEGVRSWERSLARMRHSVKGNANDPSIWFYTGVHFLSLA
jgi:hypothetical protein